MYPHDIAMLWAWVRCILAPHTVAICTLRTRTALDYRSSCREVEKAAVHHLPLPLHKACCEILDKRDIGNRNIAIDACCNVSDQEAMISATLLKS